jgi:hypothetical protein
VLSLLVLSMGCRSPVAPLGASGQDDHTDTADTADTGGAQSISMTGIAYQFQSRAPLEGARVSLVELPDAVAFSDADGHWRLDELPADTPLTPRVEIAGHAVGHHQTFRLQGSVARVYLQVVPQTTYDLLVSILGDEGNTVDPDACQVVTTISEPGIADFDDWEGFLERGDAGLLANADATISPEGGTRLYFNEQVVPDPSVERSTLDGGVLWINVPPDGPHTLQGTHAEHGFPDVEVTCAPGRFINASPPWGLTAIAAR